MDPSVLSYDRQDDDGEATGHNCPVDLVIEPILQLASKAKHMSCLMLDALKAAINRQMPHLDPAAESIEVFGVEIADVLMVRAVDNPNPT